LDEISQGPKRDFRLPSARWLVLVTAVGLVATVTTLALTAGGGRHAAVPPKGPAPRAAPAPSPTAAPGTVLFTCDPGGQSQLAANWRAGSLRAGPL